MHKLNYKDQFIILELSKKFYMLIFLCTHMHTHTYAYMSLYYFMNKHKSVENTSRRQYWMRGEEVMDVMGAAGERKR